MTDNNTQLTTRGKAYPIEVALAIWQSILKPYEVNTHYSYK
jgi:hypothetical protein